MVFVMFPLHRKSSAVKSEFPLNQWSRIVLKGKPSKLHNYLSCVFSLNGDLTWTSSEVHVYFIFWSTAFAWFIFPLLLLWLAAGTHDWTSQTFLLCVFMIKDGWSQSRTLQKFRSDCLRCWFNLINSQSGEGPEVFGSVSQPQTCKLSPA